MFISCFVAEFAIPMDETKAKTAEAQFYRSPTRTGRYLPGHIELV
jgi:hypothetical protein